MWPRPPRKIAGSRLRSSAVDGAAHYTTRRRRRHHPVWMKLPGAARSEQPKIAGALDRVAAGRDAQLAIDGHRLGLHRVRRYVQPLADLAEGEVRAEVGDQAELR